MQGTPEETAAASLCLCLLFLIPFVFQESKAFSSPELSSQPAVTAGIPCSSCSFPSKLQTPLPNLLQIPGTRLSSREGSKAQSTNRASSALVCVAALVPRAGVNPRRFRIPLLQRGKGNEGPGSGSASSPSRLHLLPFHTRGCSKARSCCPHSQLANSLCIVLISPHLNNKSPLTAPRLNCSCHSSVSEIFHSSSSICLTLLSPSDSAGCRAIKPQNY